MSQRYVALFAGPTTQQAKMVAAVRDPELVLSVAQAALEKTQFPEDPVLAIIAAGNKGALEMILREGKTRKDKEEASR